MARAFGVIRNMIVVIRKKKKKKKEEVFKRIKLSLSCAWTRWGESDPVTGSAGFRNEDFH